MVELNIIFKNPRDIAEFVNKVSKYDIDVDIKKDTMILDAKSLNGLYALQLNNKLKCIIHDNSVDSKKLTEDIKQFIV